MHTLLRSLLLLLLFACGLSARAETYVYLTNTTANPVTVSSVQYGDKQLSRGSQWGTYDTVVPPLATRKVLWMNRDSGISSGKNFYFDTTVQGAPGGTLQLKQRLRGQTIGSQIWHSASTDLWYQDREIHTSQVSTNEKMSFKAEFTGGYDDIYYTVHDANPKQAVSASADTLTVLSYNIWGIIVAKQICDRWAELPQHVKGFDVIVFQEAFDHGCRAKLLDALRPDYPYQTRLLDQSSNILLNGGVVAVSRFPVAAQDQHIYAQCSGDNCLSNKGFLYFEVIKNGKPYHLLGTHTNAYDGATDRAVRLTQIGEMGAYATAHNIPSSEAVLYAGDLNVDKVGTPTDYQQMLALLHAPAPGYVGHPYTHDGQVNGWLSGGTPQYLDYVLTDQRFRAPRSNTNTVTPYRTLAPGLWMKHDLSDHFAVRAVVQY